MSKSIHHDPVPFLGVHEHKAVGMSDQTIHDRARSVPLTLSQRAKQVIDAAWVHFSLVQGARC